MTMDLSIYQPAEMRKRFHELRQLRSEILSRSGPVRAERDEHVNTAQAVTHKFDAEIKEIEKDLAVIDQQIALLVRALNRQVGTPVEDSSAPRVEVIPEA